MSDYYDGTELLSLKDINGKTPELFLSTANKSAGKTTYFSKLCLNKYFRDNQKFMVVYRYKYELEDIPEKFFKDLKSLFFNGHEMTEEIASNGIYTNLYMDKKHCGYAAAINSADQIKKLAHLFSDTSRMFFDEFQLESGDYCSNEVAKFLSLHASVARGQGKQHRYVPVYMVANPVSIINPYYVDMDISSRLTNQTKFLRGDGFVLEQGHVDSAENALNENGVLRAFSKNKFVSYAKQGIYLNDNAAFIEHMNGNGKYICTIRYNGTNYAIREYINDGIVYCDKHADNTFPIKISVTTEDHQINYVMLNAYKYLVQTLRFYFEQGSFRFRDLQCKEAILKLVSY